MIYKKLMINKSLKQKNNLYLEKEKTLDLNFLNYLKNIVFLIPSNNQILIAITLMIMIMNKN